MKVWLSTLIAVCAATNLFTLTVMAAYTIGWSTIFLMPLTYVIFYFGVDSCMDWFEQ